MKIHFYIFLVLCNVCYYSNAQPHFIKTYPNTDENVAYAALQAQDQSGYFLAGLILNPDISTRIVKTGKQGEFEWEKVYTNIGAIHDMLATPDSNYIATGATDWIGTGGSSNFLLMKFNPQADTLWTRSYAVGFNAWAKAMVSTVDGGYLMVGAMERNSGKFNIHVIKTDASGVLQWQQTYLQNADYWANDVVETTDGGFMLAGTSWVANDYQILVMKLDSAGGELWTRYYGGTGHEEGNGICLSDDNYYMVAGFATGLGAGNEDMYLLKMNENGDTLWGRTYGSPAREKAHAIACNHLGTTLLAGSHPKGNGTSTDIGMVAVDSEGDTLWTHTVTPDTFGSNAAYSVQAMIDGGWLLAGSSNDDIYRNQFCMVRSNELGEFGYPTNIEHVGPKSNLNEPVTIDIFPHPVHSQSVIQISNSQQKEVQVSLYGLNGKLLIAQPPSSTNRLLLNTNGLESGLYLLKVRVDEQESSRKVMIIE